MEAIRAGLDLTLDLIGFTDLKLKPATGTGFVEPFNACDHAVASMSINFDLPDQAVGQDGSRAIDRAGEVIGSIIANRLDAGVQQFPLRTEIDATDIVRRRQRVRGYRLKLGAMAAMVEQAIDLLELL